MVRPLPSLFDLLISLGWIGLVYDGFPGSCLEGTQERTDGVLPYFEDDRLGVPLCVLLRRVPAFVMSGTHFLRASTKARLAPTCNQI